MAITKFAIGMMRYSHTFTIALLHHHPLIIVVSSLYASVLTIKPIVLQKYETLPINHQFDGCYDGSRSIPAKSMRKCCLYFEYGIGRLSDSVDRKWHF